VAFYLLGFAETVLETYNISVVQMLPFLPDEWGGLDPGGHASYADTVLVGSAANLVVLAISIVGASAFAKASFLIFLVIVSALLAAVASFFVYTPASPHVAGLNFTGPSLATLKENWDPGYQCAATPCASDEADLADGGWDAAKTVLGVVLPSMTGFLAGANMSGDLAKPGVAIPRGTFLAIFCMFLSYVVIIGLNAASVHRDQLRQNYQIMQARPARQAPGTAPTFATNAATGTRVPVAASLQKQRR
jgi:amino acid transporter